MAANKTVEKPITDEIATTGNDLDVFGGWLSRLENPDPVLRTEAAGKGIRLYDEVERDAHAYSVLQTRYLAVTGKEWEVLPADETPRAAEIADFVKETLAACNFDQARQEMLKAILYGYYPAEVIWQIKENQIKIARIRAKHPRRFVFDMERQPRLLTPASMIDGEPIPDRKIIIFTYGSSDNPYGCGLGRTLWWPVWFKKVGIKYWLVFLEKFGMPTGVGKYPIGTSKELQDTLLAAVESIQSETSVVIPETMKIELLEAARTGNVSHQALCDYMDRLISKTVLGQTLTTEVKGEGSLAASQTHNDVRADIMKADADLLCECLNATLISWLVDFNFAGVTEYPKMWIRTEDGADENALAERDKKLYEQGVKFSKKYYQGAYNLEEDDFELVESAPPVGAKDFSPSSNGMISVQRAKDFSPLPVPQPADFAEGQSATDTADKLANRLAAVAAPEIATWISKIKDMAAGDGEFAAMADEITAAFPDMPIETMAGIIAQQMMLANLAGRLEAKQENNGHA